MKTKRFNYYGKWVFMDLLSLGCVKTGDIVTVYSKKGDMVFAEDANGRKIIFHHTNITNHYFLRATPENVKEAKTRLSYLER